MDAVCRQTVRQTISSPQNQCSKVEGEGPTLLAVVLQPQRLFDHFKSSPLVRSHVQSDFKIRKNPESRMASSKLRRSYSFPNLLLSCLNFILFILSAASVVPIFLIKNPPTSLGWAIFMVSCLSLLSSLVGFYSQVTQFCFVTHVSLLLASSIAQTLGILALFTRENSSLRLLNSPRDPREAKVLIRVECGTLIAMFLLQLGTLILTCVVQSCWVKDYEGLEAEREAMAKKRSRRMAQVQEETMANVAKNAEVRAKDLDEKMKSKYAQWVKTDFEG